ncbi:MAG: hypothetical protein JEY94_05665 [Melioribacteraceae bacterium]|nr:hypothetical protein [Melioribacteraceae bacterium]
MKNKVFHVISNTHWDREWRFPFQRNRQMLVDMIDKVLEILEAEPDYKAFHLDSQSIVLKDYLEIKPYKKDTIIKLVKEKRLLIGPWYILPEEFQVGGENLIRNLLLGHKVCKENGGVSKIGYSPFSWGQIAQLPQLYKEFGVDLIMFYRGVNSKDSKKAEFLWEGADGTKAITSRFSTMPRYNFYFYIYRPVIHNEGFYDVEYKWDRGGTPFHFSDNQLVNEDYFIINPADQYFKENIKPQVKQIIKDQVKDFTTDHVIWMEGHDSSGPNIKTARIIKDIKEMMPEVNVVHSTLEDYAKAIYESVDVEKLKLVKGERRSAQFDLRSGNMYGYTTSARMYLKQKNYASEKWLQFYAEPFNVISGLLGRDIIDNYLDIAWEYVIQNSAHDSIGGCSLDEIHDDMMNRYKQSIEISKGVFERSAKHIINNIDTSSLSEKHPSSTEEIFVTAINPNNFKRDEIVEAFIDIPKDLDKKSFSIIDEDGNEIEYQLVGKFPVQPVLEQMIDRPMYFEMIRYKAYLNLKNIPNVGYKVFKVIPKNIKTNNSDILIKEIKKSVIIENENLKIKINKNGTFNLSDKINDIHFKNLGYFYDEGEAGHAWVNEPVKPIITTLKSDAKIEILESGNLISKCRIKHVIEIQPTLQERKLNSKKKVKIPIELELTLAKNSKRIDLKVSVDNKAESHRLRIMFPTNLDAKFSYGEGQFDVVERTLNRPDTKDWIEQPMYDYPMHHFVDITDKKHGAAVLVNGLKEYEVLADAKKTIAITLFRSFEFIIAPSSRQDYTHQKGSQCLGSQEFEMAFYPHSGNWIKGSVYEEALNFNNHISLVQHGAAQGTLPTTLSFLKIDNKNIVISSLKKPEDETKDSYILRIFNPTDKKADGIISMFTEIKSVTELSLEELNKNEVILNSKNSFKTELNKKEIKTYRIKF